MTYYPLPLIPSSGPLPIVSLLAAYSACPWLRPRLCIASCSLCSLALARRIAAPSRLATHRDLRSGAFWAARLLWRHCGRLRRGCGSASLPTGICVSVFFGFPGSCGGTAPAPLSSRLDLSFGVSQYCGSTAADFAADTAAPRNPPGFAFLRFQGFPALAAALRQCLSLPDWICVLGLVFW